MADIFQKRTPANYGTAIVKYNAPDRDDETKMLYLMGRAPQKCEADQSKIEALKGFLSSKNIAEDASLQDKSSAAAIELASRVVDDQMIERLTDNIIQQIKEHPNKNFKSVRIVVPFPLDQNATNNNFAPALAAAVTVALQSKLPQALTAKNKAPLNVVADLDRTQSSRDSSILNIVNNQRGNTSNPKQGEEVETYMQRIVRQPVYSGPVDPDTIYVPVDDFLVSQSTVAGLVNYIQAAGGTTTSVFASTKLFSGTEVLAPQQETLDLLKLAIKDNAHTEQKSEEEYQRILNKTLGKAGLHIDFDDVKKTTLSNIELLFVAGYFADGGNTQHQEAYKKAIEAVGGTVEETKGNSAHDIFSAQAGTLNGLEKIFADTLQDRILMVETGENRYQDLVNKGRVVDFKGASL
jgi:hypothetical protein